MLTWTRVKSLGERNILVVGPGALGSYFAARLGQKHSRLWVLDHRPARAQELQERGFHVTGASILDWVPPDGRVAASPRGWPRMDMIFLTVKAPVLRQAAAAVRSVAGKNACLVCLQNGWGLEGLLKGRWPPRQIVWGVTRVAVTQDIAGRVFLAAAGTTLLDAGVPAARDVAQVMTAAGLAVRLTSRFDRERWMKLIVNACVNPLGSLADVPNGRLAGMPLAPLVDRVLDECVRVSPSAGFRVSRAEARKLVDETLQSTAANRNSMLQDLSRGRSTERSFILGPFLAAARRGRVAAPALTSLDRLLGRVESLARKA
jgi:2-dehydropantoate 2-reductase